MKGNAAAIVTMTSIGLLAIGTANSVVVKKKLPSFRFFFSVGVASTVLATIAMVDEDAGKGLSLIVITVVAIDDLPDLLKELDGKGDDLGKVGDEVSPAKLKSIGEQFPSGTLQQTPPKIKTKTKTRPREAVSSQGRITSTQKIHLKDGR